MPETVADKTVFSLVEVARSIQKTLAERYQRLYWIKAEMNKLNHYVHSGHCYPELLEKKDGKVIAEMRATLWKGDYQRINQQFLEVTKEPLKNGINILFLASISYDPAHGLSLHITDIDPAYSLGELEREKQESIRILKEEGIFDANKGLPFPLLPKRIAIISVETSKGLADFLKIIDGNRYGYRFEHRLFPALLQGDRSIPSILEQLKRITQDLRLFDVVAIIRGGGGEVGLSSYNHLQLARAIATFPLPVLTGIGHATNETVSELVAYKNAITPSELADFLIQHFHRVAQPLAHAEQVLQQKTRLFFQEQHLHIGQLAKQFKQLALHMLKEQQHQGKHLQNQLIQQSKEQLGRWEKSLRQAGHQASSLSRQLLSEHRYQLRSALQQLTRENSYRNNLLGQTVTLLQGRLLNQVHIHRKKAQLALSQSQAQIQVASTQYFQEQHKKLHLQERELSLLDPQHILKRGYSITLANGKPLTQGEQVHPGDSIKTILAFGEIESDVTFVKPSDQTDTL